MIVEVGTSDFRTQAGKEDGLFIEPVKYYFDRLPECRKVNVAVSDYNGKSRMCYLDDSDIKKYNLPDWVRGCNAFDRNHITVYKLLEEKGLVPNDIIRIQEVEVRQLHLLIEEAGIVEYDHLKIDTEGHDWIILNDYLDNTDYYPPKITFEGNVLTPKEHTLDLVDRLTELGYTCKRVNFDMVCEL